MSKVLVKSDHSTLLYICDFGTVAPVAHPIELTDRWPIAIKLSDCWILSGDYLLIQWELSTPDEYAAPEEPEYCLGVFSLIHYKMICVIELSSQTWISSAAICTITRRRNPLAHVRNRRKPRKNARDQRCRDWMKRPKDTLCLLVVTSNGLKGWWLISERNTGIPCTSLELDEIQKNGQGIEMDTKTLRSLTVSLDTMDFEAKCMDRTARVRCRRASGFYHDFPWCHSQLTSQILPSAESVHKVAMLDIERSYVSFPGRWHYRTIVFPCESTETKATVTFETNSAERPEITFVRQFLILPDGSIVLLTKKEAILTDDRLTVRHRLAIPGIESYGKVELALLPYSSTELTNQLNLLLFALPTLIYPLVLMVADYFAIFIPPSTHVEVAALTPLPVNYCIVSFSTDPDIETHLFDLFD